MTELGSLNLILILQAFPVLTHLEEEDRIQNRFLKKNTDKLNVAKQWPGLSSTDNVLFGAEAQPTFLELRTTVDVKVSF